MKLTAIDLEPEDYATLNAPDKPNYHLSVDDVKLSDVTPIVVKYDYIDLGETAYHFGQSFRKEDTQAYFERMKYISSKTVESLRGNRDMHFYRSELRGNLRKAIKTLFHDADDDLIVYHFALYTSKETANREKDIRSPRIYVMHGTNGFIYPLFFDPYHELNPMVK